MDELDERLDVLQQCGFFDEAGRRDLEAAASVLVAECGVSRTDEHVATLITHVAAAFKRSADGEKINPIGSDILAEVRESAIAEEAARIQGLVLGAMDTKLSDDEKDFVLVHVGGLLMSAQANE